MPNTIKATVALPEDLHRKAKQFIANAPERTSLQDLLVRGLRRVIEEDKPKRK